jgi:hypothetical protein
MSARKHFSGMSALFEARATKERVFIYSSVHRSLYNFFETNIMSDLSCIIQIEEMAFCKPDFIIIKSNYFQNAQKREFFLKH